MNQIMGNLMQKEVSRKEFLGISGLAVASILGFGTVIKLTTGKSLMGDQNAAQTPLNALGANGYGASAYGK
jgi:hypothetical protein